MEHTVPYIFILRIENNYMNISSNGQMIFFKMMWKSSYAYSKSIWHLVNLYRNKDLLLQMAFYPLQLLCFLKIKTMLG